MFNICCFKNIDCASNRADFESMVFSYMLQSIFWNFQTISHDLRRKCYFCYLNHLSSDGLLMLSCVLICNEELFGDSLRIWIYDRFPQLQRLWNKPAVLNNFQNLNFFYYMNRQYCWNLYLNLISIVLAKGRFKISTFLALQTMWEKKASKDLNIKIFHGGNQDLKWEINGHHSYRCFI